MKVKNVRYVGKADVFNMEVEDTHDFVVQGGVVVHNCVDEIRYFCMMRPIKPREVKQETLPMHDPLNQFVDRFNKPIIRRT